MTEAEARLWSRLRRHSVEGLKFRRQHPFGPYVLDFYCPTAGLVVEVDGGQHWDPAQTAHDAIRSAFLREHGLRVLRFSDRDVLLQTESVLESIVETLKAPLPSLSPEGRG